MQEQNNNQIPQAGQAPQAMPQMAASPIAMSQAQMQPQNFQQQSPTSLHSETVINNVAYRMMKLNTYDARLLQLRIGKVLGAPFIKFMGSEDLDSDEDSTPAIPVDAISEALMSVDPKSSVDLIRDLCELTYNGSTGRKTDYLNDFDGSTTQDIELVAWVIQEQFGNFLSAFMQSNIANQALGMVSMSAKPEDSAQT